MYSNLQAKAVSKSYVFMAFPSTVLMLQPSGCGCSSVVHHYGLYIGARALTSDWRPHRVKKVRRNLSSKWKHIDKLAEEKKRKDSIVQRKLFYNSSTQE